MKENAKRNTTILLACFLLLYILPTTAVGCCDPPCGTCEHCVGEVCVDGADGTDCGDCKECEGCQHPHIHRYYIPDSRYSCRRHLRILDFRYT